MNAMIRLMTWRQTEESSEQPAGRPELMAPTAQQQSNVQGASKTLEEGGKREDSELVHSEKASSQSSAQRWSTRSPNSAQSLLTLPREELFTKLMTRCIVQRELIQLVDNGVFYPAATRKEDAEIWAQAQVSLATLFRHYTEFFSLSTCSPNSPFLFAGIYSVSR